MKSLINDIDKMNAVFDNDSDLAFGEDDEDDEIINLFDRTVHSFVKWRHHQQQDGKKGLSSSITTPCSAPSSPRLHPSLLPHSKNFAVILPSSSPFPSSGHNNRGHEDDAVTITPRSLLSSFSATTTEATSRNSKKLSCTNTSRFNDLSRPAARPLHRCSYNSQNNDRCVDAPPDDICDQHGTVHDGTTYERRSMPSFTTDKPKSSPKCYDLALLKSTATTIDDDNSTLSSLYPLPPQEEQDFTVSDDNERALSSFVSVQNGERFGEKGVKDLKTKKESPFRPHSTSCPSSSSQDGAAGRSSSSSSSLHEGRTAASKRKKESCCSSCSNSSGTSRASSSYYSTEPTVPPSQHQRNDIRTSEKSSFSSAPTTSSCKYDSTSTPSSSSPTTIQIAAARDAPPQRQSSFYLSLLGNKDSNASDDLEQILNPHCHKQYRQNSSGTMSSHATPSVAATSTSSSSSCSTFHHGFSDWSTYNIPGYHHNIFDVNAVEYNDDGDKKPAAIPADSDTKFFTTKLSHDKKHDNSSRINQKEGLSRVTRRRATFAAPPPTCPTVKNRRHSSFYRSLLESADLFDTSNAVAGSGSSVNIKTVRTGYNAGTCDSIKNPPLVQHTSLIGHSNHYGVPPTSLTAENCMESENRLYPIGVLFNAADFSACTERAQGRGISREVGKARTERVAENEDIEEEMANLTLYSSQSRSQYRKGDGDDDRPPPSYASIMSISRQPSNTTKGSGTTTDKYASSSSAAVDSPQTREGLEKEEGDPPLPPLPPPPLPQGVENSRRQFSFYPPLFDEATAKCDLSSSHAGTNLEEEKRCNNGNRQDGYNNHRRSLSCEPPTRDYIDHSLTEEEIVAISCGRYRPWHTNSSSSNSAGQWATTGTCSVSARSTIKEEKHCSNRKDLCEGSMHNQLEPPPPPAAVFADVVLNCDMSRGIEKTDIVNTNNGETNDHRLMVMSRGDSCLEQTGEGVPPRKRNNKQSNVLVALQDERDRRQQEEEMMERQVAETCQNSSTTTHQRYLSDGDSLVGRGGRKKGTGSTMNDALYKNRSLEGACYKPLYERNESEFSLSSQPRSERSPNVEFSLSSQPRSEMSKDVDFSQKGGYTDYHENMAEGSFLVADTEQEHVINRKHHQDHCQSIFQHNNKKEEDDDVYRRGEGESGPMTYASDRSEHYFLATQEEKDPSLEEGSQCGQPRGRPKEQKIGREIRTIGETTACESLAATHPLDRKLVEGGNCASSGEGNEMNFRSLGAGFGYFLGLDADEGDGTNHELILRGGRETLEAIANGEARVVKCLGCKGQMQVARTASLVFCPVCRTVSPAQLS